MNHNSFDKGRIMPLRQVKFGVKTARTAHICHSYVFITKF